MDIQNKTAAAIRVPLGAGKRLFLSVGGTGQISPKAAAMPAVKALLDSGAITIKGVMAAKPKRSNGSTQHGADGGPAPGGGGVRHVGAR